MTDPFADPGTSSGIDWRELNGALLLFTVHGVEHDMRTAYGTTDAVRVDVAVIDGTRKGDEHADALVFPRVLQSQLRTRVGQKVLARLGQGTAKPGQSAPWQLLAATDEDKAAGRRYLDNRLSEPDAPPQQSQQSQSWGATGEPPF